MKYLPAKFRKVFQGFTLIELLVVIAIIAILMSLLFPSMGMVMDTARRASAQNDVVQISNAVVMFETEYGRLPPDNDVVGGDLLNALINEGSGTNFNTRRVRFLDAPNFRRNRGGVTNAGGGSALYLDPWEGEYQIVINTDYENSITVGGGEGPPEETIRKQVGVWNTNATSRLRVGSW